MEVDEVALKPVTQGTVHGRIIVRAFGMCIRIFNYWYS